MNKGSGGTPNCSYYLNWFLNIKYITLNHFFVYISTVNAETCLNPTWDSLLKPVSINISDPQKSVNILRFTLCQALSYFARIISFNDALNPVRYKYFHFTDKEIKI